MTDPSFDRQLSNRVIVIEDNVDLCTILMEYLNAVGYSCDAYESPHTALQLLRETTNQYALVITDMEMGEINGLDVIEQVCQVPPIPAIIVMSGLEVDEIKRKIEGRSVDHILRKPFSLDNLLFAIRDALDRHRHLYPLIID